MHRLIIAISILSIFGCSSVVVNPKIGDSFYGDIWADKVETPGVASYHNGKRNYYKYAGEYKGKEFYIKDLEYENSPNFRGGIFVSNEKIVDVLNEVEVIPVLKQLQLDKQQELEEKSARESVRETEKKQEQSNESDDSVFRYYGVQRSSLDESQKQFFDIFMHLPPFAVDINRTNLTRDEEKTASEDNEKINKMGFIFDHKEGLSSVYTPRKDNLTYKSISNWTCVAMTNKKESEKGQCKMIGDITWDKSIQSPVYYKKDIIRISGETQKIDLLHNNLKLLEFALNPTTWLMALFTNPNNKDLISKAFVEDALPWNYRIHLKNVRIEIVKEFHEPLPNSGPKECQQDGLSMVQSAESTHYPCEYNSGPTKDDCGRPLDEVMDTLRSSGNYCYQGRMELCYAFNYIDKSGSECPSIEEAPNYRGARIRY